MGIAFLYLMVAVDNDIPMSNDKSTIFDVSWEFIQKYVSNQGKVLFNMKKLREYVDNRHCK